MTGRLRGKVAIVTGAARGIGASIATMFVAEGAQVVGLDLKAASGSVAGVLNLTGDVTQPQQIAAAVGTTLERFGKIDILINNAGVNVFAPPLELADADWDRCLEVDLKGSGGGGATPVPASTTVTSPLASRVE